MKTLKQLIGLLTVLLIVSSCDKKEEPITPLDNAGTVIDTSSSSGKILGAPAGGVPIQDAAISFADVELDFNITLKSGNPGQVTKYEVVKSINGGPEVSVGEYTALPINIGYSTIDQFIAGLGIAVGDIRIGDVFKFRVRVYKTDGSMYVYGTTISSFAIIVNCGSNLAGTYAVSSIRSDGNTYDLGTEAIVEVSPGYYKTVTTGGWAAGTIAPDQGFNFQDTCNELTVPDQDLCQGYYSNDVTGLPGNAILANGDLVINYTIDFSAGALDYTSTYVKQP
jgi:hypothetical protein